MKRDMGLIRLLLPDPEGEEPPDLSSYTPEQLTYHRALLVEAGHALEIGANWDLSEAVEERTEWPHC